MCINSPAGRQVDAPVSFWADQWVTVFGSVLSVIAGTVFGSFLNCAAFRTARGESFVKGHSRCPDCGHELGAMDLIPVLSWVFLKGRCRYCGKKISARYPASELTFALLTLLCLMRFGFTVLCLRNWIFIGCLFFLSIVDLESYTIPDGSLLIAALAWFAALPFLHTELKQILLHVLSGVIFGGAVLLLSLIMDKLLGRESLGGGDVKLIAVCGLYLGFIGSLFMIILACILGLAFALLFLKGGVKGKPFPFGPAISLAAAVMLLFGQGLTDWYLGLMGL